MIKFGVCHLADNDTECDLGPGIDLEELRRNVALLPSIPEISTRLEAALGIRRTSNADIAPLSNTLFEADIQSPKSVASHGLSQVDSGFGFGSPPCFVLDEDDSDENDEGELDDDDSMSGIEPLDALHHDDDVLDNINNRDLSGCSLTVAGKNYSGGLLCTSMYSLHRRVCIFCVIFGRRRMMNVF